MAKYLVALLLALLSFAAIAGSRGYYVAFVDISETAMADGMDVMLALRKSVKVDGRAQCWSCEKRGEDTRGIQILYLKKLPPGVNSASVRHAIKTDAGALKALRRNIRDFADTDGTRLDGLYVYERGKTGVTVYVISPRDGAVIRKLEHPVKTRIRLDNLDAMLEKLAPGFPMVP